MPPTSLPKAGGLRRLIPRANCRSYSRGQLANKLLGCVTSPATGEALMRDALLRAIIVGRQRLHHRSSAADQL